MEVKIRDKNLYYVGGVVRDEILGVQSLDVDLCYEGNAIEFAHTRGFEIIRENPEFGTVRVLIEGKEADIASTRTETYPKKGHLPLVDKIGCSLKDDLARRDFTINALAKNTVTGEIVDYFNGLEDLKNKKLRVLHDKSFIDDPSRIVRALKFSVRFGFELEEETRKLQEQYLENINYDMSFHRLKKELKETFNLNKQEVYEKFVGQKIYKLLGENQIVPLITNDISKIVLEFCPSNVWLVYLGLYGLSNFDLTSEEKGIIVAYEKIKEVIPKDDYEIYKMFSSLPLESILLYSISVDDNIALHYLRELADLNVSVNGDDLANLGIKQGKIYKEIFDYLLRKKIENPQLTKEDEIILIKEMLCK